MLVFLLASSHGATTKTTAATSAVSSSASSTTAASSSAGTSSVSGTAGVNPNMEYEFSAYATLLQAHLLGNTSYNPKVPPTSIRITTDSQAGTDVKVQLRIFKIESLDQSAGQLKLKVWLRFWWHDLRLSWDPADFGGITETQMKDSGTDVWVPDVMPYNSLETMGNTFDSTLIRLRHDGELMWSRPGLLQLMCKFSGLVAFPFDELSCLTELGGWTMGGAIQGLIHQPGGCLQSGGVEG